MKLPRRLSIRRGEAPEGDLPLGGLAPLGDLPMGLRPRGDSPASNRSSAAGSGTEAKRAGANTCVGCRKAPPRPLTMRCSGSNGCRFAIMAADTAPPPTAWLFAACAAHKSDSRVRCC
jgi:hypothetical protein